MILTVPRRARRAVRLAGHGPGRPLLRRTGPGPIMNFSRTIGPGIRPGNSGPILGRGPGSGGGSAGAGMVVVRLNGKGEMKGVRVDPKLADPAEMEMLQDLLMAAHADAKKKSEAKAAEEMQALTGGLQLPPGFKLPF